MQESHSESSKVDEQVSPAAVIEVQRSDLPIHCPMDNSKLWSSHPRVYIPVEEEGEAVCPYCGAVYKLID